MDLKTDEISGPYIYHAGIFPNMIVDFVSGRAFQYEELDLACYDLWSGELIWHTGADAYQQGD
jgi:hypothetical protein